MFSGRRTLPHLASVTYHIISIFSLCTELCSHSPSLTNQVHFGYSLFDFVHSHGVWKILKQKRIISWVC